MCRRWLNRQRTACSVPPCDRPSIRQRPRIPEPSCTSTLPHFHEAFCADLPAETAAIMAVSQRPGASEGVWRATQATAWKTLPSWALIGTADKTIGVTGLRLMAGRAGAISVEVDASHVAMISQPAAVADLIRTALGSVGLISGTALTPPLLPTLGEGERSSIQRRRRRRSQRCETILVLIHGLWMTPRSWEHWVAHRTSQGTRCWRPAYPGFEVEVEALRADPSPIAALAVPRRSSISKGSSVGSTVRRS